jgi:hypothetical protein
MSRLLCQSESLQKVESLELRDRQDGGSSIVKRDIAL